MKKSNIIKRRKKTTYKFARAATVDLGQRIKILPTDMIFVRKRHLYLSNEHHVTDIRKMLIKID